MFKKTTISVVLAAAGLFGFAASADAGIVPYQNSGTANPNTYTFTATATGDIVAYFAGATATYTEAVGLLVNGTLTSAGYVLGNHSSAVGEAFNLGFVHAGDTLVFVDHIYNGTEYGSVFSDSSLNAGYDGGTGVNHVYSTSVTAGQLYDDSPAGIYVAFEDLPARSSDYNYMDDTFIFTNVSSSVHSVPEPFGMSLVGFGLLGLAAIRRRSARR